MTTRTIAEIESATNDMVGSFQIKNVLPVRNLKQIDPFLLLHHLQPVELVPGSETRLPPHPHAGFEVVTYLLDGEFFHRDSQGHNQIAKAGDVNWMTAGAGILHSEGPTEQLLQHGGKVQLIQLWINVPAENKHGSPTFNHYAAESFPVLDNGKEWVKVLLGSYKDLVSPVSTQTPMYLYHAKMKKDALVTLPVTSHHTAGLYIMKGRLKVLNQHPVAGELVHFNTDGNQLVFTVTEDAELLFFGGEPIKEKVVHYGPFVMNSLEEIQQAMADFETGKMGILEN